MKTLKHFIFAGIIGSSGAYSAVASANAFNVNEHDARVTGRGGATRPFAGKIESWSYAPVNDTELVASVIRRKLGLETSG